MIVVDRLKILEEKVNLLEESIKQMGVGFNLQKKNNEIFEDAINKIIKVMDGRIRDSIRNMRP